MNDIPDEMITEISKYLNWMDRRRLAGVNKICSKNVNIKELLYESINYVYSGCYTAFQPSFYDKDLQDGMRNLKGKELIYGGIVKCKDEIIYTKVNAGNNILILTLLNYKEPDYDSLLTDIGTSSLFLYKCKCGIVLSGSKYTLNKHKESVTHLRYILANYYKTNIYNTNYLNKMFENNWLKRKQ